MPPRLYRSRRHRVIAGVCGGIAERLGWSPLVVRVLFVAGAVLPIFPGAVAYLALWLVLPRDEIATPAGGHGERSTGADRAPVSGTRSTGAGAARPGPPRPRRDPAAG